MSQFTNESAIPRDDLGVVLAEYIEDQIGYVASTILPVLMENKKSGEYSVKRIENMLNIPADDTRALYGEYNSTSGEMESGSFSTSDHGLQAKIDDRELDEAEEDIGPSFDLEGDRVKDTTNELLRAREKRVADSINGSRFSDGKVVDNAWTDAANATVEDDLDEGMEAFKQQTGRNPNVWLMTEKVFKGIRKNQNLRDLLKYTFPGMKIAGMTPEQVAEALNSPRIVVAGGMANSAHTGNFTLAPLWDDNYSSLILTDDSNTLNPCIGRTFVYSKISNGLNPAVDQYRKGSYVTVYNIHFYIGEEFLASIHKTTKAIVSDIAARCIFRFSGVSPAA